MGSPRPPLVVRGAPRSAERAEGFRHLGFDRPPRQICARQPGRPQPRRPAPGPRYPAAAGLGPPANASPPALLRALHYPLKALLGDPASWGGRPAGSSPMVCALAPMSYRPKRCTQKCPEPCCTHTCPEPGCTYAQKRAALKDAQNLAAHTSAQNLAAHTGRRPLITHSTRTAFDNPLWLQPKVFGKRNNCGASQDILGYNAFLACARVLF